MSEARFVNDVAQDSKRAARKAAFSPLAEFLARLGYGARGLIYLMMGVIAVQVANGAGKALADQQGAIAAIGAQPSGHIVLIIVLVGLAGYSLWGLIRALFDPLHQGKGFKGLILHIGYLISAVSYAYLIMPTYGLITGSAAAAHNGSQTAQTQHSVASLFSLPGGRTAVIILGIIVILVGLNQVSQGLGQKFTQQFKLYSLNRRQSKWIERIGRFGTAARGVVFALVGVFLALAGYQSNPGQARGIDGALLALARQPYGVWLLGIVAIGLIAFGVYSLTGMLWFRLRR